MVWTVLTGMRDIAMLEKMWPPTWKHPMGRVSRSMALLGGLNLLKRTTGLMKSMQKSATKPNWTKVKVTGYLNRVMMALPVLDDSADDMYHSEQSSTKQNIAGMLQ